MIEANCEIDQSTWKNPNASIMEKRKVSADSLVGFGSTMIHDVLVGEVCAKNLAKCMKSDEVYPKSSICRRAV